MSDIVSYTLILGLVVIGSYAIVWFSLAILNAVYENLTLLLAFPFF